MIQEAPRRISQVITLKTSFFHSQKLQNNQSPAIITHQAITAINDITSIDVTIILLSHHRRNGKALRMLTLLLFGHQDVVSFEVDISIHLPINGTSVLSSTQQQPLVGSQEHSQVVESQISFSVQAF